MYNDDLRRRRARRSHYRSALYKATPVAVVAFGSSRFFLEPFVERNEDFFLAAEQNVSHHQGWIRRDFGFQRVGDQCLSRSSRGHSPVSSIDGDSAVGFV